jgi:FtsP/CotA-like multicopper oxidase with cupredoxin domain
MNRRNVLKAGAAGLALAGASTLPLASLARGGRLRDHMLIAQPSRLGLLGDDYPATDVWAFNNMIPGPVLRANQGDTLRIRFRNRLAGLSTIHWHGIRLPNAMDGVPGITQAPVKPGEDFMYEFALPDAGTYWYHPHVATYEQIGRGLYGVIQVEERQPPDVDDDVTWVLSDVMLTKDASIAPNFKSLHDAAHAGRLGNIVLVNGQRGPATLDVRAGQRIRLRLLNAASARLFRIKIHGHQPLVVAHDGHPCTPYRLTESFYFSPGNRMDLILDCTGAPNAQFEIEDEFFPAMRNKVGLIRYSSRAAVGARKPFGELPPNTLFEPVLAGAESVKMVLEGGALSNKATREAIWLMNGKGNDHGSHMDVHGKHPDPLFTFEQGCTVRCLIDNKTAWFHPMHFHGIVFRERLPNGQWGPFKDSTLVWPFKTQEIAFVAESPGDWMIHCHVAEHQHSGLMGTFRVASLCRTSAAPKA